MDPEKIKILATLLDVTPEQLTAALEAVSEKKDNNPLHFYYNPDVFMKLHTIDYAGLRKLVMPDLRRLRA